MKLFKLLSGIVLCVGLCCVIAGGGIFYARYSTAYGQKKIKELPTYRLSAFTELQDRETLTLCAARGLAAKQPENSLPAVRAAGDAGYSYILLDVAMTRDKVPVLLADDTLSRMTAGRSPVRTVDFDALRSFPLDNGAGIDKAEETIFIPALSDALEICAEYGMTPILTVRTLRGMTQLQTVLQKFHRSYGIASGEKDVLSAFQETGCLRLYRTGVLSRQAVQYARKESCALLFDASQTRAEQIRDASDAGLELWAQTVRSRTALGTLAENGVRKIVTDCILPLGRKG